MADDRTRMLPQWQAERSFAAIPTAVRAARRFAVAELGAALRTTSDVSETLARAELVVSELVTNAINSGSPSVGVRLELLADELVVSVADQGVGMPRLGHPDELTSHGRGLLIIDQLADDWGCQPAPPGKRVWARLPVALAA